MKDYPQNHSSQEPPPALVTALVDSLVDATAIIDREGALLYGNSAFLRWLDIGPSLTITGVPLREWLSDETVRELRELPLGGLAEAPATISLTPRRGSTTHVQAGRQSLPAGPGLPDGGYLLQLRPMGSHSAREAELESGFKAAKAEARANAEFLATMSHEIRTPINGLIGMAELLLEESPADAPQRSRMEAIHKSGSTLLALVNDILDYSKMEAGQLQLESIPFNIVELCQETLADFGPRIADKGIYLNLKADPRLPPYLRGDPLRVRQVLYNLVGNAIKFTSKGGVTVALDLAVDEPKQTVVRVVVQDTGIGIPVEKQHKLFRKFSQTDSSTARNYGGTGLGLAITKQLAELMRGQITVQSVPGAGTIFTVTLRFEALRQTGESLQGTLVKLRGARILALEQRAELREALLQHCHSWGLTLETVDHPDQVIVRVADSLKTGAPYEVLLFQHTPPTLDALALLEELREERLVESAKVILMGRLVGEAEQQRAKELRAERIVPRPVSQSALLPTLAEVLQPAAAQRLPAANASAAASTGPAGLARSRSPFAGGASSGAPPAAPASSSGGTPKISFRPPAGSGSSSRPPFAIGAGARPAGSAAATPSAPGPTTPTAIPPAGPLRVLLVDDNQINLELCLARLRPQGHAVTPVASATAALDAFRREEFDLVLMDVQMPDLDGLEATRQLRRLETSGRRVPVIALTARVVPGDKEACMAAGMDGYLAKPFSLKAFDEIVQQVREGGRSFFEPSGQVMGQTTGTTPPLPTSATPRPFPPLGSGLPVAAAANPPPARSTPPATPPAAPASAPLPPVVPPPAAMAGAVEGRAPRLPGIDLSRVVAIFLKKHEADLNALGNAWRARDWRGLNHYAHSLKGALAIFAAEPARAVAADIERSATAQNPVGMDGKVAELDRLVRQLADHLRANPSGTNLIATE